MQKYKKIPGYFYLILTLSLLLIQGCGFKVSYSFTGINIQPDVKSITVNYFENRDPMSPSLSNNLTNALIDKYRKLTRLDIVPEEGDLEVSGEITGYKVTYGAVTADETPALNRLTITIKITYVNNLHPEDDLEQTLSKYADFDSNQIIESVRDQLEEELIELLVEEIFNATVAQWK